MSIDNVCFHFVQNGKKTKGWLHSHGMLLYQLPELEMRRVPAFLQEAACDIMRAVCWYMMESGKTVKLGETMALSERTRFRLVKANPILGQEDHYEVERWRIVEIKTPCDCCGQVPGKQ